MAGKSRFHRAVAIFASLVLILMVYHAKFRKVMFWLAGLSAVGVGLFYLGLYLYNAHEERVQHAELDYDEIKTDTVHAAG